MKYILTSSFSTVANDCQKYLGKKTNYRAVFIDTAADMYDKSEEEWLQTDKVALQELGYEVTDYTLAGKSKSDLKNDLSPFDIIFVSGGNTFYLLEKANASGFTELIQEDYFKDKIYIGSSAGSVLLSHDITSIQFLDDPKHATLDSYKAIGIVNFVILPHWGSVEFQPRYVKTSEYIYTHSVPALTLSNNHFVVLEEGKLSVHERDQQDEK